MFTMPASQTLRQRLRAATSVELDALARILDIRRTANREVDINELDALLASSTAGSTEATATGPIAEADPTAEDLASSSRTAANCDVGVHRIHLVWVDDGVHSGSKRFGPVAGATHITAYLPLDVERRLLRRSPAPWLVKAALAANNWFGEISWGDGRWNLITWSDDSKSLIDLGTVPVRVGAPVVFHLDESDQSEPRRMVIKHVQRV